jgi:peptide deformylase
MALLTVLEYPDKRLRLKATPVATFDEALRTTVANMFETMYQEKAVGLAATQVNVQQRIIVMDVSEEGNAPLCMINPAVSEATGTQYEFEGCISFPNIYDKVERAANLNLTAFDQHGKIFKLSADGLLAVCIQHEIDHLEGILFIDHLSRLKRERNIKKLAKERTRDNEDVSAS